jgi:hypothetical protein
MCVRDAILGFTADNLDAKDFLLLSHKKIL